MSRMRKRVIIDTVVYGLTLAVLSEPALAVRFTPKVYQRRLKEQKARENLAAMAVPPFRVFTERPLSDGFERGIRRILDQTVRSVGEHFGFKPSGEVEITLFDGATYDSVDDPEVASGGFYANKKIRLRFDFGKEEAPALRDFERVFRHEYTHLVIASLDAGKTPRWLNEGLAEYEERGPAGRKRGEGREFYESHMRAGTFQPVDDFIRKNLEDQYTFNVNYFYENSYLLAKHLVEKFGFGNLHLLFRKMKEGSTFAQAFGSVYDLSLEELAKGAYES